MSISALVSNSLCVDSIILTVRTDESYVRDTVGIVDPYYDSILVPRDIEDRSSVLEDACVADIALYVCRSRPVGLPYLLIPRQGGFAGVRELRIAIEKSLQRPKSDRAARHGDSRYGAGVGRNARYTKRRGI